MERLVTKHVRVCPVGPPCRLRCAEKTPTCLVWCVLHTEDRPEDRPERCDRGFVPDAAPAQTSCQTLKGNLHSINARFQLKSTTRHNVLQMMLQAPISSEPPCAPDVTLEARRRGWSFFPAPWMIDRHSRGWIPGHTMEPFGPSISTGETGEAFEAQCVWLPRPSKALPLVRQGGGIWGLPES